METLANFIKQARKREGLTQKELAEITGLKRVTIASYESNKREMPANKFLKICKVLHVNGQELAEMIYKNFDLAFQTICLT